jgi:predicted O-methyltransferase YrrM
MSAAQIPFSERLETIANGFRDSQVFLSAVRLNLFSALGEDSLTAKELAEILACQERGIRILCDALTGIDLLIKDDSKYKNHPESLALLCEDSEQNRLHQFNHMAFLYERWGHLRSVVQNGLTTPEPPSDKAELAEIKKRFALAMMNIGRQSAVVTADALDLGGVTTLLDVGGGPGLYAIEFAKRCPELHATVLDDADTLKVTQRIINEAGMNERVDVFPGNVFTERPARNFDFIFVSNVIHQYSSEENMELTKHCADLLSPGGVLCLKDFFLNESKTSPAWGTLFAVNMLVNTEKGDCYSITEGNAWLKSAELKTHEPQPVAQHSMMLFGQKII